MLPRILITVFALTLWSPSPVAEFCCDATRKFDVNGEWDRPRLRQGQWHVLVQDDGPTATLSRCSFAASQGRVTCDEYEVDRIETDPFFKAKKYYVFRSQYDVQIFEDLTFVENNGRTGITYGTCRATAP